MDDDALMRQVAAGDEGAFAAIVRAYQRPLTRFAERILVGDPQSAHDVVQEAFVLLWRMRAEYKPQSCLRSLLYRIVHNVSLDCARRAKLCTPLTMVTEHAETLSEPLEAACQSRALGEAIRQAVRTLPESQRVVFVLSQYEQLSYQQIAAILGCPIGTVASRKRLAVDVLRRKLRAWMDNEP